VRYPAPILHCSWVDHECGQGLNANQVRQCEPQGPGYPSLLVVKSCEMIHPEIEWRRRQIEEALGSDFWERLGK
jgi:hypothetical protein